MDLHPLDRWLVAKELKVYEFAEEHGLNFKTLYSHVNGDVKEPSIDVMERIEDATKGQVSLRAQIDWVRRQRRARGKRNGL